MKSRIKLQAAVVALFVSVIVPGGLVAQDTNDTRERDVIYARKHGVVLTMDVFTPKEDANGAGIVYCVSGGWFSSHRGINAATYAEFLKRGYTVFAVVHGSQPKFAIPEILLDMHRAVRFIRHNAKRFKIDADRIGISGGSAGGHLSLMQGTAGNAGNPQSRDPIDRVSSRVQAVACFFPPTDFLNYGKTGENAVGRGTLKGFQAPFQFKEFDRATRKFVVITDEDRRNKIGRAISPLNHVTKDDPPTLIMHGDADKLVPIQQAELIVDKMKKTGVTAKLIVKKGAAHGWPGLRGDFKYLADWFDTHLKKSLRDES